MFREERKVDPSIMSLLAVCYPIGIWMSTLYALKILNKKQFHIIEMTE